jgi:membrane protein implicated in regulation of membrane protease activity
MSNRGLVVPVDGRRMISTVVGVVLIAAGAILRFAGPATVTYGLNAHVVSVIVMLAGIFSLLLSLLVWGPLSRRSRDRESTPQENEQRAARRVP